MDRDHDLVGPPGTPSLLRAINDRTALWLLADRGPLSRTQLGALAGLSKPTASQLMDRLEAAGLVEAVLDAEPAHVNGSAGRTARRYRLRGAAAHVAGLDVTAARIVARVCDLSGRTVGEATLVTPGRSASGTVDRVREALTAACATAGMDISTLHHVVIGIGGAIDPGTGRLGFARHLPGWHEPDLLARLRTELTGPGSPDPRVDVENDVNLVAVAEQTIGAGQGARDVVVLWVAEGIGAAVIIDGKLHRGATGGAGEVGYMPVPGAPVVRSIGRGTTGGFQALAGGPAVLKLARQHGFTGADPQSAVARAVEAIAAPAAAPVAVQQAARRLLTELADRLATGLAPIVAVLDPELIVLTGAIPRSGGAPLRELVAEALHGMAIPRPRLVESALADNPVLAGAIHAALAATREAVFDTSAGTPVPA
ncbi:MAG TPA: ROK family transcriptional regulator [Actinocrinis sp.]|uniref:ROK family transcriptional regulator n=1 Tax=Actinocrinis sp. TaxID=1920516 RepID=UPI002D5D7FA6|nr:ROK family transcriptional regulator [Actinocrinis sp.]HZU55815.1 ROK family transcriptional regulator [Actinocrinis sp.]